MFIRAGAIIRINMVFTSPDRAKYAFSQIKKTVNFNHQKADNKNFV